MPCTHRDERDVRAEALEEAAKHCEKRSRDHKRRRDRVAKAGYADSAVFHDGCFEIAKELAEDIRALVAPPRAPSCGCMNMSDGTSIACDDHASTAYPRDPKRGREF